MSYQEQTTPDLGTGPVDTALLADYVVQTLERQPGGRELIDAIRKAGLETELLPPSLVTVFLASGAIDPSVAAMHVIRGENKLADLRTAGKLKSIGGSEIPVKVHNDDQVFFGDAKIIHEDIACRNGVIHIVDHWASNR